MSGREICKSFVVGVPVTRAWQAFTDPAERRCWEAPRYEIDPQPGGKVRWEIPPWPVVEGEVLEVEPERLLRQREDAGMLNATTEITVTFESVDGGTRITITHAGFGDGAEWGDSRASHSLGWDEAIADLVLYLMQGAVAHRFFTPWRTILGLAVEETAAGVRVLDVQPGGYAEEAGLQPGDIVTRIGGIPIFARADLWSAQHAHAPDDELAVEFARESNMCSGSGRLRANTPG